jgi:hypothetical protein
LSATATASAAPTVPATATLPAATEPPSSAATSSPLTLDALQNAEYQSDFTASHTVKLVNGAYEAEAAPGSASKVTVNLLPEYASGDLHGDGVDDAAVVLVSSGGGSGTFYTLAAVVNDGGHPRNTASLLLGDRIQLKSVAISDGEITVDMIKAGPNDPMCCPSLAVQQKYRLDSDTLALIESTEATASPATPAAE